MTWAPSNHQQLDSFLNGLFRRTTEKHRSSVLLTLCGRIHRWPRGFPRWACIYESHKTITMTAEWARWRLKSPDSLLFTQPFIQAQIKENIKAPRHWPLCGEFTGDRWIPRTNGQYRGKCFHLMTSSCAECCRMAVELCHTQPYINNCRLSRNLS